MRVASVLTVELGDRIGLEGHESLSKLSLSFHVQRSIPPLGEGTMASAFVVIAEIKAKVGRSQYSRWHFGLTNDVEERKKYWGNRQRADLSRWRDWAADSLREAQAVERYFSSENMINGGTGGSLSPDKTIFVYIF